jgi:hypothetical protein
MLSQAIWWIAITLEGLLLIRGLRGQLFSKHPVFYAYIAFVLSQSFVRLFVYYHFELEFYRYVYWLTEFLGVAIGCGVLFEIYRVGLWAYPGTARMARKVLLLVSFMAIAKGLIAAASHPGWWAEATVTEIEQALRVVQALAVTALVILFLAYAIHFGTNLRGILLGYSLFVDARIVCLPFLPIKGHNFWFYAYSASYPLVLSIWVAHLWSYSPEPKQESHLEQDYQRIAAATRLRLSAVRGYLGRAVRS